MPKINPEMIKRNSEYNSKVVPIEISKLLNDLKHKLDARRIGLKRSSTRFKAQSNG